MTVVVAGIGLVSPRGMTPAEHVFQLRADVRVAAQPAFLHGEEKLRVGYCPWLGARLPLEERLGAMAGRAAVSALEPLASARARGGAVRVEAMACVSAARPDLPEAVADRAVKDALAPLKLRATMVRGAAAFFQAIGAAEARLAQDAQAVLLLAVDSFVSEASLAEIVARGPSPWSRVPPRPSEGAAALVLMEERTARALGVEPLATVVHAATLSGAASDDNDAPVDGAAMTKLLFGVSGAPIVAAYGQNGVDALRSTEWHVATARARERFSMTYERVCLEDEAGALGAAAGAAGLSLGIAAAQHRALARETDPEGLLLAWAISRDGLRGLAAVSVPAGGRRAHG